MVLSRVSSQALVDGTTSVTCAGCLCGVLDAGGGAASLFAELLDGGAPEDPDLAANKSATQDAVLNQSVGVGAPDAEDFGCFSEKYEVRDVRVSGGYLHFPSVAITVATRLPGGCAQPVRVQHFQGVIHE